MANMTIRAPTIPTGRPISNPYLFEILGISTRGKVLGLTVRLIVGPFTGLSAEDPRNMVRFWPEVVSLPGAPNSQSLFMFTFTYPVPCNVSGEDQATSCEPSAYLNTTYSSTKFWSLALSGNRAEFQVTKRR